MVSYNSKRNTSSKNWNSKPVWYNLKTGLAVWVAPTTNKDEFVYFPSSSEYDFFLFCLEGFKHCARILAHPLVYISDEISYRPDIAVITDDNGKLLDVVRESYHLPRNGQDILYLEWKGNITKDKTFAEKIKKIMLKSDFTRNCLFVGNEPFSIVAEDLQLLKSSAIIGYSKRYFVASLAKIISAYRRGNNGNSITGTSTDGYN